MTRVIGFFGHPFPLTVDSAVQMYELGIELNADPHNANVYWLVGWPDDVVLSFGFCAKCKDWTYMLEFLHGLQICGNYSVGDTVFHQENVAEVNPVISTSDLDQGRHPGTGPHRVF